MKVWDCKIGSREPVNLPSGADSPMRKAIAAAYKELTGIDPEFIFSGWGGGLEERELAVVEDRLPVEPAPWVGDGDSQYSTNGDKDAVIADLHKLLQTTAEAAATHRKDKTALREALENTKEGIAVLQSVLNHAGLPLGTKRAAEMGDEIDKALANRREAGE